MAGIEKIEGTVTLSDGRTHEFSITEDGRTSWGAGPDTLGETSVELDEVFGILVDMDAFEEGNDGYED